MYHENLYRRITFFLVTMSILKEKKNTVHFIELVRCLQACNIYNKTKIGSIVL
jgi:hypothetical protein